MRRFSFNAPDFQAAFKAFLDERRGSPADVDAAAAGVLEAVKTQGLDAVLDYSRKFDKVELTAETIRVTPEEIEQGWADTPADVREAIAFAAARIRAYHSRQRPADQAWTATSCADDPAPTSSPVRLLSLGCSLVLPPASFEAQPARARAATALMAAIREIRVIFTVFPFDPLTGRVPVQGTQRR